MKLYHEKLAGHSRRAMVLGDALISERQMHQEELALLRSTQKEQVARLELARETDLAEIRVLRETVGSYETRIGLLEAKRKESEQLSLLQQQEMRAKVGIFFVNGVKLS